MLQVCPCICFCAYVEEQLQVMHDNAEVITARIVQEQKAQEQEGQHSGHQQQQDHPVANGNHSHDSQQQWTQQQQQQPRASANGLTHRQRMSDSAALAAVVAAASTKLRVLARPINEFSSCRREWVLKLGKAIAMAFMQKAAGATATSGPSVRGPLVISSLGMGKPSWAFTCARRGWRVLSTAAFPRQYSMTYACQQVHISMLGEMSAAVDSYDSAALNCTLLYQGCHSMVMTLSVALLSCLPCRVCVSGSHVQGHQR